MNEEISKLCDELDDFGQHEGTETGEWWQGLAEFGRFYSQMSEDFQSYFRDELNSELSLARNTYEIVEVERTHTFKTTELQVR